MEELPHYFHPREQTIMQGQTEKACCRKSQKKISLSVQTQHEPLKSFQYVLLICSCISSKNTTHYSQFIPEQFRSVKSIHSIFKIQRWCYLLYFCDEEHFSQLPRTSEQMYLCIQKHACTHMLQNKNTLPCHMNGRLGPSKIGIANQQLSLLAYFKGNLNSLTRPVT